MDKKAKILALCLLWIMCFAFAACEPVSYSYKIEDLKENVLAVDLIKYNNSDVRRVRKQEAVLPFDFEKVTIIETLDEDEYDRFFSCLDSKYSGFYYDLGNIIFYEYYSKYPSAPSGICIMMTYKNGDVAVFCNNENANFCGEYDRDGMAKGTIGHFVNSYNFMYLVNDNFNTKITESGTIFRSWE